MKKTLAIIINHNRKSYTNALYRSLKPYERNDYDLFVLDNGSTDTSEVSEFTSFSAETNSYYGGALNITLSVLLENPQYDSLLVLNNDIILHPYHFVQVLRNTMFDHNYHVVSPSVLQPEETQCYWPQMHNWGSAVPRPVRWVDFMCPLLRRDVVEHIREYDNDLIYGWGQDVYTGIVCEQQQWNLAVVDTLSVIHLSSQTFKDKKSDITVSEYGQLAMGGMVQFFEKNNLLHKMQEFRTWGQNYQYV